MKINETARGEMNLSLFYVTVTTMEDKTLLQAQMLANRLQKRFRHLKKWAQRTGAGAFRLYDRDIPEIPLVLDYYGDCAVPMRPPLQARCTNAPTKKTRPRRSNGSLP